MHRKYTRPCAQCGVIFSTSERTQKYCGRDCYVAARRYLPEDVLRAKVDTQTSPDGCHPFTGNQTPDGYGLIVASGKQYLAHRFAYHLAHGPIPDGLLVCHACDNPACCRIDHLFLGTNLDNSADMAAKGRAAIGERNSQSKLTAEQVREVRQRATTGASHRALARSFGVSKVTIARIIHREIWRHVA